MTIVSFEKAPLVEIIAELRWNPPDVLPQAGQGAAPSPTPPFLVGASANRFEEFFMRFGMQCARRGFQQSERLVPPGFPVHPFQPVYRFRRGPAAEAGASSELLQVGPGLFSANALPPYKSWTNFSPVVRDGVSALLDARHENERNVPFSGVSLRYIDAFGPDFMRNQTPREFISSVLGFKVELPEAVEQVAAPQVPFSAALQLSMPSRDGLMIGLSVGQGVVNGADVVVLDTTVSAVKPVGPDIDALMATFDSARSVIHAAFVRLVEPIYDVMRPREE